MSPAKYLAGLTILNIIGMNKLHFFGFLLATTILIVGCDPGGTDEFKIVNSTKRDVKIFMNIESDPSFNVSKNSHQEHSHSYEFENRDSYHLFFDRQDSTKLVFNDGKVLTFYNHTPIYDSTGNLIKSLPPRIDGANGIQELSNSSLKNILSYKGWSENCNSKRHRTCTYTYTITDEHYKLAK